jgi:hypothetical protein
VRCVPNYNIPEEQKKIQILKTSDKCFLLNYVEFTQSYLTADLWIYCILEDLCNNVKELVAQFSYQLNMAY